MSRFGSVKARKLLRALLRIGWRIKREGGGSHRVLEREGWPDVLIEQDEDGGFVATVPALPGCIADGGSRDEALRNVREAIALYIESLEEHGDPIPSPITEEVVEV